MKPLTDEMDQIVLITGRAMFLMLRNKFPNNNVRDADLIFNSLIFALLCHRHKFCDHDHKSFKDLVNGLLDQNG